MITVWELNGAVTVVGIIQCEAAEGSDNLLMDSEDEVDQGWMHISWTLTT
jgi:hypothetical protein